MIFSFSIISYRFGIVYDEGIFFGVLGGRYRIPNKASVLFIFFPGRYYMFDKTCVVHSLSWPTENLIFISLKLHSMSYVEKSGQKMMFDLNILLYGRILFQEVNSPSIVRCFSSVYTKSEMPRHFLL